MLSFKQFLKETPSLMYVSDYKKSENVLSDHDVRFGHEITKMDNPTDYKKISKLGKYEVWHSKKGGDEHYGSVFNLVNPQTGHVHMQVTGNYTGKKTFKVGVLTGQDKNPVKAHQFYHHLITRHGIALQSSDLQSHGGMKTWQRLATQYPDINMSHDNGKGKTIPLHTGDDWKKNYGSKKRETSFIARKQ